MTRFISAFIALTLSTYILSAQEIRLFGINNFGGSNNTGNIYSMNLDGSDRVTEFDFAGIGAAIPVCELLLGSDGIFYGTLNRGGVFNSGAVFSIQPDGSNLNVLYEFKPDSDGDSPSNGVIELPDGKLCGVTSFAGANDAGTLFKVDKDGSNFEVLHHFEGSNGSSPYAAPILGSDGKLYGTTTLGGNEDWGVLYSINTNGTDYSAFHFFDRPTEGALSYGRLYEDNAGYLYGTMSEGGPFIAGGIFKTDKTGADFSVLQSFSFDGGSSSSPYSGLILASNGKLYGTASSGGDEFKGNIFSINPDGTGYEINYSFVGNDGQNPLLGNTLVEVDGQLYGTNFTGGANNGGTIYKVNLNGTGFTKILDLNEESGTNPYTGLTLGPDGLLHGVAPNKGNFDDGTYFTINTDGSMVNVVHDFVRNNQTGAGPVSKLVIADDWAYATTQTGGTNGAGSAYRFNLSDGTFEALVSFEEGLGSSPQDRLVYASDGMLYGTTRLGGNDESGTIFRMVPGTAGIEVVYHFTTTSQDGARPAAGLTEGADGKLYGVTQSGGINGVGSIFSFDPSTSEYAQLFSFEIQNTGFGSQDPLIEGSDGKLYGVTLFSGDPLLATQPRGTLFSIEKDGSDFTVLKQFDDEINGFPGGPVLQGPDDLLYGSIGNGSNLLDGALYRIAMDGTGFEIIHTFTPEFGVTPRDELLFEETTGFIYGMTRVGGAEGSGTIFKFDPLTLSFEKVAEMGGFPNGANPIGGLTIFELPSNSNNREKLNGIKIGPNPSSGIFNLIFENDFPFHKNSQVIIADENGKQVFEFNGNLITANSILKSISQNWSSGNYFIEIKMEGKYFSETLVLLKN